MSVNARPLTCGFSVTGRVRRASHYSVSTGLWSRLSRVRAPSLTPRTMHETAGMTAAMGPPGDLDERIAAVLGRVVDWPSPGVRFTDVSAVWEREPDIFRALVGRLCDHYAETPPPVL